MVKMIHKTNNLIVSLMIFSLMISSVSALTQYTGQPQLPYLVYGKVVGSNGLPVPNAQLTISNSGTGYTKTVIANVDGYWQEDAQNWLTNYAGRPSVQYGDTIQVTAVTGCGGADTCVTSIVAFTPGYDAYARVDFSLTGITPTPSTPSGSGGSSHSGGGSGISWTCAEWSACTSNSQQTRICLDSRENKRTESKDCEYIAPKPKDPDIKPPVVEPVINEPKVEPPVIPPVEPEKDTLQDVLLRLIAGVIGIFAWGAGFRGLIIYYLNQAKIAEKAGDKVLAKKHRDRAEKMARTVILNFLAGKYKK